MSALANFLESYIEQQKTPGRDFTDADLARRMKLSQSVFSRFINSKGGPPGKRTLLKMVSRISPDPQVQAGLLAAYLRDHLAGPASHLVQISVAEEGARIHEEPPEIVSRDLRAAPPQVIRDIQEILRKISSPELRRSLHDLAEIARVHIV